MTRHLRWLAAGLGLIIASAAGAQPASRLLDPMFADHAVLQRRQPIALWGHAAPGQAVDVTLGRGHARAVAGPDGRWLAHLSAMAAGGPYTLSARAGGDAMQVSDVAVGDVFLCSGQSNMEWPVSASVNRAAEVAGSADPSLRILTIPQRASASPVTELAAPAEWKPAAPSTVGDFSAVCFFMGQEIRRRERVPVGLIDNSWGGSAIGAWLSADSWRASGGDPALADLLSLYARDPAAANLAWVEHWQAWWSARDASTPWRADFRPDAGWQRVPALDYWEKWGIPALANFDGMTWYRTIVTLSASQAAEGATLSLGTVDDVDQTWVNGRAIGNTSGANLDRLYPLSPGTLHAGENAIVVNALDVWGYGGIYGPAEKRAILLADSSRVPLDGTWLYRAMTAMHEQPPRAPWDSIAGISTIDNGMVVPIGPWGLKAIAWYQGESDAWNGRGYQKLLRALIGQWRAYFGAHLPVAVIELPDYGAVPAGPVESGWADLRDSQRRAVAGDPAAALVVTIDLGEPGNLHPPNKRPVGARLARAIEHIAYGAAASASGPMPVSARRSGDGILVRFADVDGGLAAQGIAGPFELCGAGRTVCQPASARIVGKDSVLVTGEGAAAAARIRYCWGDSPVCGLRDAGLPAGPFELSVN